MVKFDRHGCYEVTQLGLLSSLGAAGPLKLNGACDVSTWLTGPTPNVLTIDMTETGLPVGVGFMNGVCHFSVRDPFPFNAVCPTNLQC
jgi:hypothetical protein